MIICPGTPSSNVVSVCEDACVFQRLPSATEGVVSEPLNVPNVPAVLAPKAFCISIFCESLGVN